MISIEKGVIGPKLGPIYSRPCSGNVELNRDRRCHAASQGQR